MAIVLGHSDNVPDKLHIRAGGVYSFSGSGGSPPKKPKAPVKPPTKKPKK